MRRTVNAPTIVFFFFSSRRRHTRFDCDWSSDVCSSDLGTGMVGETLGTKFAQLGHQVKMGSRTANNETAAKWVKRSEEHTSELQSQSNLVCRLLLEKKKTRPSCQPGTICRPSSPLAYLR